jgi:hypothetical protein
MSIQAILNVMHQHLMYRKFPYHSVSVIHRSQDLGFHVYFMESVREMITEEIKNYMGYLDFTYSFVKENKN